MHEHVRVCVLACLLFFCFVHLWGGQIIAERVYEVRIWFSHICWVWVACCLTRLSVSYDKYAIQSRNKMWLLSFRDITVKSYSTENLNMSREGGRKRAVLRRRRRGQCFPCLFSKFESAGDSFIMRKTTTAWWFFSVFTPWEDQHSRILDMDAFPCIWSLSFLKCDAPVLSVF